MSCRSVELESDSSRLGADGGAGGQMPLEHETTAAERRDAYNMSRLRSSSLEIREKGTEFLREQLDAAQKVVFTSSLVIILFFSSLLLNVFCVFRS